MTVKEIGIIVHGATGRIGATQHLANALAPIRAEGGLVSGTQGAAQKLGLKRTTLQSKMRKLRISRKDYAA